ncbi:sugar-binding domain-containing protein [Ferrimonas sp. YFM]|uniref:glycoside hydrolase family 2 protein n=1 Tax=Ferrimonas sp. YFM TaxID=3028878 RepID=UPI00257330C3|nr:sugar-binding domain-containing protein [Ferrimonas sp. YFM]BDY03432.1 beta-galactosidase [Ferrimonas sp. YFM]
MRLLWMAALLLFGCHTPQDHHQDLSGNWRFQPEQAMGAAPAHPGFDDSHWPEIRVPGNWTPQGQDTHGAHWYRTRFRWQPGSSERWQLRFEGVDYHAEVWLNGHRLGGHSGYFAAFSLEATNALRQGDNLLAVRVDSPLEPQEGPSWSLHKGLIKGVLGHHDTRAGGAWGERGQELNTGGIWGRVELLPMEAVTTEGSYLSTSVDGSLSWGRLHLSYHSPEAKEGRWRLTLTPVNFDGDTTQWFQPGALTAGAGEALLTLPKAERPLWWPAERGFPHLYRLTAEFLYNGAPQLTWQRTMGFRSVDYDGQLGRWTINGRPLFLRGTNYIPHQYLSLADEALLQGDLALMRQANINVVRVHAHLLPQRFYELANASGMLVWQDFPLQWGYEESPRFQAKAEAQLQEMVDQFGHHPSIITWSAHNEPPWDADWMRYRYPDYTPQQNLQLDLALYGKLRTLDPGRPAFALSRTAEHPWFGWYSGSWQDYGTPTTEKLITEFGAQALPDAEVLYRILGQPSDWPSLPDNWEQWQYHNFQPKETFELAGIEPGADVPALVRNTQAYQARLTRYAAESYRRQKYKPVGAIFQFMLVEHWPSMNWGVLDYRRNPKPGFHALAQAYQPLLPSIVHHQNRFGPEETVPLPVVLVNDHLESLRQASLTLSLYHTEKLVEHRREQLDIPGDSVMPLAPFPNRSLPPGRYRAEALIHDQQGQRLARSDFEFEVSL